MKLVKMSLVAALLMGSSAFAIENLKVDGNAKLFYGTDDHEYDDGVKNEGAALFDQSTSYGEASLKLGATADLTEGISAGATLYAISTLGLYNNLVSATWTGGVQDNFWFGEAWLAGTVGNTTAKVGRMELDTPLVFSEQWSVAPNTFEAAVLVNTDLPDTTLVGAYVGQSNGGRVLGGGLDNAAGDDAQHNIYSSFWNGAYAVGAVNNSFQPLTVQAWYFTAQQAVDAYWLQADMSLAEITGLGLVAGLQYTGIDYDKALVPTEPSSTAYAAKLGFEADAFTVSAAYSAVDEDGAAGFNLDGAQSKLYTEAWWNYGYISQADTTAINVTATYSLADVADFGIYYTDADQDAAVGEGNDLTEITLEAAKSFGPLDAGLYYISTEAADQNNGDQYNALQVYLTYNF